MEDMSRAHGVLLSGRFQESRNNDLGERAMPLSPWRWYGGFVITRHLLFIPIHISPCRYIRHFNMDGFVVPSFEIKHYRKRKC